VVVACVLDRILAVCRGKSEVVLLELTDMMVKSGDDSMQFPRVKLLCSRSTVVSDTGWRDLFVVLGLCNQRKK
jgi:hypothetical protein